MHPGIISTSWNKRKIDQFLSYELEYKYKTNSNKFSQQDNESSGELRSTLSTHLDLAAVRRGVKLLVEVGLFIKDYLFERHPSFRVKAQSETVRGSCFRKADAHTIRKVKFVKYPRRSCLIKLDVALILHLPCRGITITLLFRIQPVCASSRPCSLSTMHVALSPFVRRPSIFTPAYLYLTVYMRRRCA